MKFIKSRYFVSILLILAAVISIAFIAPKTSSISFHQASIKALDEKKETVLKLTAAATGTSVAISAVPGDTATPVAEKLIDLSGYFLLVLCAILLEKYLLTITCFLSFTFIIPVGLAIFLISLYVKNKQVFYKLGTKLVLFGFMLVLLVPVSVKVSAMVENTYEASFDETLNNADTIQGEADSIASSSVVEDAQSATSETGEASDDSLIDKAKQAISDATDAIQEKTEDVVDTVKDLASDATGIISEAKDVLNQFMEALAVMIITSCVMPILVLVLFAWLLKIVVGINIDIEPGAFKRKKHISKEE